MFSNQIIGGILTGTPFPVVDVSTCEPVTGKFVEIWGTNATGIYSGVQADTNGDASASNLVRSLLEFDCQVLLC